MKRHCDNCGKWIECRTIDSFGGHRAVCLHREQISKNLLDNRIVRKEYKLFCSCGNEYTLKLTERTYLSGDYRKHCSQSCANSRIQTKEMNEKRRKKLKFPVFDHKVICRGCENEFEVPSTKKGLKRIFCSPICACKYNIHIAINSRTSDEWSEIQKLSYKNGINFVAGGTTKWFSYKSIKVQGTYELRSCCVLDAWKEQRKIKDWSYAKDRFRYIGIDGKEHTYIVDFKIFTERGFYYLEVKGYIKENDRLKWDAVRKQGYYLEIWFNEDIKREEARLV